MSSSYTYTPLIWPSFLTVLLLIVLAAYTWRRRSVAGAVPFLFACLFSAAWAAGSVMEYAAQDMATKISWIKFQAAWQLCNTTAITCFILDYAWPGRWLTRRNLTLLSMVPLVSVGLILTDDLHHWIWSGFTLSAVITPLVAPVGWLLIAYGYVLALINLVVLAWLSLHSPQHLWPAVLIVTGQLSGRLIYTLERSLVVQSTLPLDVLGLTWAYLIYAIALFGFRIFDPVALARLTVIDQLKDGMLVLDREERVTSLNPAAEKILGSSVKQLKGRPVREVLPVYPAPPLARTEIEINLPAGQDLRTYTLAVSLLKDWRGLEAGRMVLLRDVTEQKRAQAQLVEQQNALAMLRERERLARELHDGIGQVLGYISVQAQAIRKRSQAGDQAAVEAQLGRLAQVAQAAHTDIRESILSLKVGAGQTWSFRAALCEYLEAYRMQYAIQTELNLPDGFSDGWFEPETEVQLLRVIQEALTNARKHGQASQVQVSFADQGIGTCIVVADDGRGFDLQRSSEGEAGHYGLQFMRERMLQIGGSLEIDSAPGQGTRVRLLVNGGHDAHLTG